VITQTAEYALRAIVYLAGRGSTRPASAQEISRAIQVPVGYLQKILRMMAKADLLTAQRGSGGGFALAKVPSAIRVIDVLEATDAGIARIERCPLGIEGHTRLCALHRLLDEQIARAQQAFAVTSIATLLDGAEQVRPLCDLPPVVSGPRSPDPEASDSIEK